MVAEADRRRTPVVAIAAAVVRTLLASGRTLGARLAARLTRLVVARLAMLRLAGWLGVATRISLGTAI